MRTRALDSNGDWTFGRGANNYLSRNAAVVQDINTRIQMWLGDCFFDRAAGIDWQNRLGSRNQQALQLAISTTILGTHDVVGIKQLSAQLNHQTRNYAVSYQVETSFSTVVAGTFTYSLNGVDA
jgi:hypothetical protein